MKTKRFAGIALISLLSACRNEPVAIHVVFKLVDNDNNPVAGVPLRIVAGIPDWDGEDWRAPDAGTRVVTDHDGTAQFSAKGIVDRRWIWEPVGFTSISVPVRVHHAGVGFEVARVLPGKRGDVTHHWFYTADFNRYADGTAGTYDIDRVYEAGADKRFTQLLAVGVSSPDSVMKVDGMALSGSGYRLADFRLDPDGTQAWMLRVTVRQLPKPVLRQ